MIINIFVYIINNIVLRTRQEKWTLQFRCQNGYAYIDKPFGNAEKQCAGNKCEYIGKYDEKVFTPNKTFALLYGEGSMLPVYYRKLAGNITDVKTIENLIKDVDFLKLDKLKLFLDRGFYSEKNINNLMKHTLFEPLSFLPHLLQVSLFPFAWPIPSLQ